MYVRLVPCINVYRTLSKKTRLLLSFKEAYFILHNKQKMGGERDEVRNDCYNYIFCGDYDVKPLLQIYSLEGKRLK